MRKPILLVGVLALAASSAFASLATVSGADHRDAPLSVANPQADINDVYAFRSPENPNNVALVITTPGQIAMFDTSVAFQVHMDNNGDLTEEAVVNIRRATSPLQLIIDLPGQSLTVPITTGANAANPIVVSQGGVKAFFGLRDDPFFFDLGAVQTFVANPVVPARGLRPASAGAPVDTFAGLNANAIVVEMPIVAVTGGSSANSGTVKIWVTSSKNGFRIDRTAIPRNGALIPAEQKDAFNQGDPINDAGAFRAVGANTIRSLRGRVDGIFGGPTTQDGGPLGYLSPEQVAAALIPDVVSIDFSRPLQFPNGRRLQDDVVDVALGIGLNRGGAAGISDGINANDRAFGTSFPYLAVPHTAVPAPADSQATTVRPPSTGDGGLLGDGHTLWRLSGGLFLMAIVFGCAGVLVAQRSHR